MELPQSSDLKINALSRLFDTTSECYKFFWFQAVITKVLENKKELTFEELIDEMIAEAWYMVTEYHLNLGPRDTLEMLVHHIQDISGLRFHSVDFSGRGKWIKRLNITMSMQKSSANQR